MGALKMMMPPSGGGLPGAQKSGKIKQNIVVTSKHTLNGEGAARRAAPPALPLLVVVVLVVAAPGLLRRLLVGLVGQLHEPPHVDAAILAACE